MRDGDPDYDRFEELSELDSEGLDEVRREIETFQDRVYWLTRQIPPGRVATYGQLALLAGSPRAARAVGQLMRTSVERGLTIPWHRVVNASGGISGRDDVARCREQRRRLEDEEIAFENGTCDLESYRWTPDVEFWERDG